MKNLVKLVGIIVMAAVIVLAGCESKEQKAEKARIAAEEKALADLNAAFANLDEAAIAEFARTLAPEVIATILKDAKPEAMTLVLNNASPALVTTLVQENPNPWRDFSYNLTGDGIIITRYSGQGRAVIIPATIEGYPVTGIGRNAFNGQGIISVIIPEGVRNIGSAAFEDCTRLTSVILPSTLKSIGVSTFSKCRELYNLSIPDGLVKIDFAYGFFSFAFMGCEKLPIATRQRLYDLGYEGPEGGF